MKVKSSYPLPGQEQYILNYIIGNEHQVIPLNCKEFYTFDLAGLFCENLKNPEYLLNIHLALSDPFCIWLFIWHLDFSSTVFSGKEFKVGVGRAQTRLGSLLKKALARAWLGSKEARLEVARLEIGSRISGSKLGSARRW